MRKARVPAWTGAHIDLRGKEVVHKGARARPALLHTNVREGLFWYQMEPFSRRPPGEKGFSFQKAKPEYSSRRDHEKP
jgi:hypothetical protein